MSITEEIKQGVKLKKVEPPVEKVKRRPLSIFNSGSMGQLGSMLSQGSGSESNKASESLGVATTGTGSVPADLNDLFSQLEDVLNS